MKLLLLFWRKVLEIIFRNFPLQNKVIFDNFGGRGMGDDPKYIAIELLRRHSKLGLYWIVSDKKIKVAPGITPIVLKSFFYYYHMMTAKVLVDNIKHSHHLQKRKGQYYIQTWHATVPLKKVEQEVFNLGQYYIINAVRHSIDTDLMYTNNDFHKYRFEHSFWYHGPVIKCDVPRLSILLNTPSGLRQQVCDNLAINGDKRIVLYAPTFRGNDNVGPVVWDYHKIIKELNKKFDSEFVMLLRLHPNLISETSRLNFDDTVLNATYYPDMQELLAVSDVLITDYSSTMFDFGVTGRPVFLYCEDLIEYCSGDRALEFSMDELPFGIAKNEDEFVDCINKFSANDYSSRLTAFYDKIGLEDSGKGPKVIADIIEKRIADS